MTTPTVGLTKPRPLSLFLHMFWCSWKPPRKSNSCSESTKVLRPLTPVGTETMQDGTFFPMMLPIFSLSSGVEQGRATQAVVTVIRFDSKVSVRLSTWTGKSSVIFAESHAPQVLGMITWQHSTVLLVHISWFCSVCFLSQRNLSLRSKRGGEQETCRDTEVGSDSIWPAFSAQVPGRLVMKWRECLGWCHGYFAMWKAGHFSATAHDCEQFWSDFGASTDGMQWAAPSELQVACQPVQRNHTKSPAQPGPTQNSLHRFEGGTALNDLWSHSFERRRPMAGFPKWSLAF